MAYSPRKDLIAIKGISEQKAEKIYVMITLFINQSEDLDNNAVDRKK